MPRGRALTDDLRETLIRMCRTMDIDSVIHHTNIPRRTLQRLLSDYRRVGTAVRPKGPELRGRRRKLTRQHVKVSLATVHVQSLQGLLDTAHGYSVPTRASAFSPRPLPRPTGDKITRAMGSRSRWLNHIQGTGAEWILDEAGA